MLSDVSRGRTDQGRDVVYAYARCDGGRCAVKPRSNIERRTSRAIGEGYAVTVAMLLWVDVVVVTEAASGPT